MIRLPTRAVIMDGFVWVRQRNPLLIDDIRVNE